MPEMNEKRYLAASVLDEDDNMWVLGGYEDTDPSETSTSKTSEVFQYSPPPRQGRWRRGSPPKEHVEESSHSDEVTIIDVVSSKMQWQQLLSS